MVKQANIEHPSSMRYHLRNRNDKEHSYLQVQTFSAVIRLVIYWEVTTPLVTFRIAVLQFKSNFAHILVIEYLGFLKPVKILIILKLSYSNRLLFYYL